MTLAELRTELQARGFDYLSTVRCSQFLNDAYLTDIAEAEDWPWLEATSSGTAPLTITDLRTIELVIDSTAKFKLQPLDRRNITDDWDSDLTTAGDPAFYYTTTGTTVAVYPTSTTHTISVRYWKVPATLGSDLTEPALPTRFHSLIVDAAVARAYEDNDEWDAAEAARQKFEARLDHMRVSLLNQQHDETDDYVVSDYSHADSTWSI